MTKVIMKSWREGMNKVLLSKLQMQILNFSLHEAKENVDSLLNNSEVVLKVDSLAKAKEFIEKANSNGVNCIIILDSENSF